MIDLKDKQIILASGSPRRRELLSAMDIPFTVDTGNTFDESWSSDTPHEKVPELMSEGKSFGFHRELADNEILVTSDTMVLCGTEILGKPKDRDDAIRMLKLLSGRGHQVITAVTLRDREKKKTFSVTSNVFFKELSDSEITYYLDTYKPYDKAGAYGIQEWIGYIGISRLEGSFYNVMGFPASRFYEELKAFLD
ncbi:MAG: Maf family nucleotide pyrophosphatase [Bacteroidales bacterium]|uniref:Maf family nucleotide pyrophosphatase n=1 Tax=Candidatus Cryptobacteroides sp. TaxID=2952915 RepID=UPI002A74BDF4|nr:Maf family nucleotide pyrophosphatase [Candidatus Cryptobacteroides sp.]MBS7276839.1 septum formation protein Maf [Bacteroidales bacterium]MCI6525820.1 Maf family nucleotide pyrophosphatase [Bacteroidales bacterium]MDD7135506.1 Maf family nucleotide pyrophosphatase [Bacteroidales bacterium]MDD7234832.1 Maf family nucleotide pyrophosphatase [Bacteroidales bacterium]MDD7624383.1 Maf family nucleotide pyrophosphatase [Bacteroidales bacterium]